MRPLIQHGGFPSLCAAAAWLLTAPIGLAQGDDRLVGVWVGATFTQTVELVLLSDGHYHVEFTTVGAEFGPLVDRGRYKVVGQSLRTLSYRYFPEPATDTYQFQCDGDSLSLTGGSSLSLTYQLKPGSREDVLAREQASHDLVRRWTRHVLFVGDEEWTFRPGGCYVLKDTHDANAFPPEFQRGRYDQSGTELTVKPYSLGTFKYEVDIFGSTLTLVSTNSFSGEFTDYTEVPGSAEEIAAKTAEAQAFLSNPNWAAGLWQAQDREVAIDLLLRPDGIYTATNTTQAVRRVFRGRYTLTPEGIHLIPFVGQVRWTLDDANFGMTERTYVLDYYDGELQIIDLTVTFTQSIKLARRAPGSAAVVMELARQAQAERNRDGWYVGIWEAQDPTAWMEFTFRPDFRYLAKSGEAGAPTQVERGQYVMAPGKITLAPYAGNGPARGFELDLYDGNLFVIGDAKRLVMLRKKADSVTGVMEKTRDPVALKGERGSILGLWTANRPRESVELVFRQDGQFRLKRCTNSTTSYDYGLYAVDLAHHTLIYDSRLADVQTQQIDFYGETMTLYGGLTNSTPTTYTVNLGSVDAAMAASVAEDVAAAQVDAQWLARVPISPKNPNAVSTPIGELPADPNPGRVFQAPTVFPTYQFYRQLIPCFVVVIVNGSTMPMAVVDTREWHFFNTGRVLYRLKTNQADWSDVTEQISDFWGAYQIQPKPTQTDVLHCYADNELTFKTDLGEQVQLTLENGRRVLFEGREHYLLGDWAQEQKPIPCELSVNSDPSLLNTGVSLSTDIPPDPVGATGAVSLAIAGPVAGAFTVSGTTEVACSLVLQRAALLRSPITWESLQTNHVPAGPFSFVIQPTNAAAFFRVLSP